MRYGRRIRKNKRGSLQDVIYLAVILLFFSIVLLIGFTIVSGINDELQASDVVNTDGKTASTTLTGYYTGILDNSFLFLAIGMGLVTIMLAALVRIHPMFIPFFFIGLVAVIFVCGIFSNIYQEMAATPALASYASQLTFTTTLLEVLPLIVGFFGILLMIVMYKTRPFVE